MPMHLRFGKAKLTSPSELVSRVNAALTILDENKSSKIVDKAMEDVSRYLEQMKCLLLGCDDQPSDKKQAAVLNQEAIKHDLVGRLLNKLKELEFETRKDVGLVVGAFLRMKEEKDYPMVGYFEQNEALLHRLSDGYKDCHDPHIGLISGGILRDCVRHESLARLIARSNCLLQFFDEVAEIKFEISADAFATFREVIVRHKEMMSEVLLDRFDEFFPKMNALVQSENSFFIRRQTLKLLSEILLEPENHRVAERYVSDVRNLMMLMNCLRDKYDSIQFEAFHSFKVFLIGQEKDPEVLDILQKNKQKMLQFFQNFQLEKAESDEAFAEEKDYVCELIQNIQD